MDSLIINKMQRLAYIMPAAFRCQTHRQWVLRKIHRFQAEAEKRRLDIDPATGEELDSLAKEVMTATPDIVERVKKMIGL